MNIFQIIANKLFGWQYVLYKTTADTWEILRVKLYDDVVHCKYFAVDMWGRDLEHNNSNHRPLPENVILPLTFAWKELFIATYPGGAGLTAWCRENDVKLHSYEMNVFDQKSCECYFKSKDDVLLFKMKWE